MTNKGRLRYFNSFRIRSFLVFFIVGFLLLLVATEVMRYTYRDAIISQKLSELRYTCNIAAGELNGQTLSEALTEDMLRELGWVADYCGGRLLLVDNSCRIVYDSYGAVTGRYCISEDIIRTFYGIEYSAYKSKTGSVEFTLPVATRSRLLQADRTVNGVLVVSASVSWVTEVLTTMTRQVRLLQTAAVMILFAIAFITSGVLSNPWNSLLSFFRKVLEGDLNVESDMEGGYTETRQILDTFNGILERLRVLDESRQEFVSNVSHELKTPITSIRVLADSLMGEENVPVDIYREFMSDISSEIDRETKIINDLLSLARLDKNNQDLNVSDVNINSMLEQILGRVRPIAKQRGIEIVFESFRPVTAQIDETKLGLAFTNLVENGVKYNNDGGWVRVSLNADHKFFFVRVADSGVGIPEDAKEKIFERFYRVDKARSRETGGTGLGLAITKSVISLHHGSIRVDGKLGEGTVFTVRIPLKYVPVQESA